MKSTWLRAGTLTVAMVFAAGSVFAQSTAGAQAQDKKQAATKAVQSEAGAAGQKLFVQRMLMANAAEIQLGKMGAEKGTNDEVKKFAQMMVTQHTQANDDLKPLAKEHALEEPAKLDAKHQAIADRLAKLEGEAFDREFMTVMVTSHREALAQVRPMAGMTGTAGKGTATGTTGAATGTAAGGTIQDAKQYAAKALPSIQDHLKQAEQIQKSLGKSK